MTGTGSRTGCQLFAGFSGQVHRQLLQSQAIQMAAQQTAGLIIQCQIAECDQAAICQRQGKFRNVQLTPAEVLDMNTAVAHPGAVEDVGQPAIQCGFQQRWQQ